MDSDAIKAAARVVVTGGLVGTQDVTVTSLGLDAADIRPGGMHRYSVHVHHTDGEDVVASGVVEQDAWRLALREAANEAATWEMEDAMQDDLDARNAERAAEEADVERERREAYEQHQRDAQA